ncbi:MAG: hypothetical protein NVS1B7_1230 [Candidatus Saccharimonadales bacterium]
MSETSNTQTRQTELHQAVESTVGAHESGLREILHELGHVVAVGASVILAPYSPAAEASVLHATSDRRNHITASNMTMPASWGSNRRT